KPQRIPAIVPIRSHHVVECNLNDHLLLYRAAKAMVLDRVLKKPLRHLADLSVGQPRIRLSYIQQLIPSPDCKGVVAEDTNSASVSELHCGDNHIEGRQLLFQFQPRLAATSRRVR